MWETATYVHDFHHLRPSSTVMLGGAPRIMFYAPDECQKRDAERGTHSRTTQRIAAMLTTTVVASGAQITT